MVINGALSPRERRRWVSDCRVSFDDAPRTLSGRPANASAMSDGSVGITGGDRF